MDSYLTEVTLDNGLSFNWQDFTRGTYVEYNGIYLTDIGKGHVSGQLDIKSHLLNPTAVLHGGVAVTLADTLAIMGCGYLYESVNLTTTNLTIQYLKSVTSGTIYGKGKALSRGKSVSTWQIDEYDEEDNLFATVHVSCYIGQ